MNYTNIPVVHLELIKEREIEYEDRKMGSPKKAADLIRPFLDGADRGAGKLLGIALKDHIILGDNEKYYSFLENKEHWRDKYVNQ